MKHLVFFLTGLLLIGQTFAQNKGVISGSVINRKTLEPLPGITLKASPGNLSLISDSAGNFRIGSLSPGSYSLQVTGTGFQPLTLTNLSVTSGNENVISIELEPIAADLSTVVITGRKNTAKAATLESPLSIQRLTTEDIKANPGGNFDISKVIQSLPGVGGGAAGGSFRNDIIIRGGAPSENVFYLDGIEVPVINHFSTQGSGGGPQGILNVSFIEEVKLSTSAFDARYDNTLSSVFQFKQKNGNSKRLQGNFRLSGTEMAATFDGPLSKKTTFLASARRSYLEFLFQALDLPIRPNYWDFQFKTNTRINNKTTLTLIGLGAIDEFKFGVPKSATPEKLNAIKSSPLINQWNYTFGATLQRLNKNGYWNLSLSRNTLYNQADKYEDNEQPVENSRTLKLQSNETENKLRFSVVVNKSKFSTSFGVVGQLVQFDNNLFQRVRPALNDSFGNPIQPALTFQYNAATNFLRYGAFVQTGTRLFNNRLALSGGLRIDANTLSNSVSNPLKQLSPRISASVALSEKWNASASFGIYHRLPAYTQLTFSNNPQGTFSNPGAYIKSTHYVAGVEYLPKSTTRFTLESFYKQYGNYPVSVFDGISMANKGTDFGATGNEPVTQNGKGRVMGFEFFAQQKLTKRFFAVFSFTWYRSEFTGTDGVYRAASWDNKQLISFTGGYKMKRNWELGLKFRYQGAAPYTPYDLSASQLNYITLGNGVFDYNKVNSLRLPAFHAGDIRVDKKWNLKKTTIDLYLDIQNFYGSKNTGVPDYTFKRNDANTAFLSTDGQPVKTDGSNAIPLILDNRSGTVLPTIGFIVEF